MIIIRDRNLTRGKRYRQKAQIPDGFARYLHQLDSNDRQAPLLARMEKVLMPLCYWTNLCWACLIKDSCTTDEARHLTRWEHEQVLEQGQRRLDGIAGVISA